jgi:hypothetical protein
LKIRVKTLSFFSVRIRGSSIQSPWDRREMSSGAEHFPDPLLRIPEARREQGVPGSRGKEKGKVLEGGGQ